MVNLIILFRKVTLACALSGAISFCSAASFTNFSAADAFVARGPTGNLANNNYGGGGALGLAAPGLPNGEFQTVLRFNLSDALNAFNAQYGAGGWQIQSVLLRLSSSPHNNVIFNDVAAGSFGISLMQNNSWTEGTGNASNPAADGITFASLQSTFINSSVDQGLGTFAFNGGTNGANFYQLNLSPGLVADILGGTSASFRLFAADDEVSYLFSSRSMPAAFQPQLIIIVPEPAPAILLALGLGFACCRRRFGRVDG